MRPALWLAPSWTSVDFTRIKSTSLGFSAQLPFRLQQGSLLPGSLVTGLCLCQSAFVPGTGSWHVRSTPWDAAASVFLTSCIPFQSWDLSQLSPVVTTWLASYLFREMKLGSIICSYPLSGRLTVCVFLLLLKYSKCPLLVASLFFFTYMKVISLFCN